MTVNKPPKRYTIKQLVGRFYRSKYNRDYDVPLAEGEDENDSMKSRIYNKSDIKDLLELFIRFFEWVLVEDNIENVHLSKNMSLMRQAELPKIKMANVVDKRILGDKVEVGKYYATKGKYSWKLWISNELFQSMAELWEGDPDRQRKIQELAEEIEKRNG